MVKGEEYYIGLDMGTNSVGWAVTNPNYELLKFRGKDMWGMREFDEALGSADRRSHRVSRRRRQREIARQGLVKSYFDEEVRKVDSNFFVRLENSKFHEEDKDVRLTSVNSMFNDKNYKDKDYFKEYPTSSHLRSELIHNTNPHDIRLAMSLS